MPSVRPRIVAAAIATAAIFGAALLLVAAPAGARGNRPSGTAAALEQQVLIQLNVLRRENGLAPLRRSSPLAAAARQHSQEMARYGFFGHRSADGSSFSRRISRFYPIGRRHHWAAGENILWSSPDLDAATVLQMWLASPEHRKNLLSARWRDFGLGAVHAASAPGFYAGRTVTIVTADFGVRR
jgi:uncharacterized protein YkwD